MKCFLTQSWFQKCSQVWHLSKDSDCPRQGTDLGLYSHLKQSWVLSNKTAFVKVMLYLYHTSMPQNCHCVGELDHFSEGLRQAVRDSFTIARQDLNPGFSVAISQIKTQVRRCLPCAEQHPFRIQESQGYELLRHPCFSIPTPGPRQSSSKNKAT